MQVLFLKTVSLVSSEGLEMYMLCHGTVISFFALNFVLAVVAVDESEKILRPRLPTEENISLPFRPQGNMSYKQVLTLNFVIQFSLLLQESPKTLEAVCSKVSYIFVP